MKRAVLRADLKGTLFDYFTDKNNLEVHAIKEGTSYLCKKQVNAGGAAANPSLMNERYDFTVFTGLPVEYYRKNYKDFLWVSKPYLVDVYETKDRPNKELKHILLTMGE